ncbi:MAG: hypothetical protein LBV38_07215 [Alistipes sp.]|jgi:hypothetical protein|nr:hypothetical protein [Alistipes sp.]
MNKNFDNEFQALLTEMVEIAFEYVNRNSQEVDAVYAIGLIESGYFYKSFYRINGTLVKSHKVNSVSRMQYDIARERAFGLLKSGTDLLERVESLFRNDGREVPSMLKLVYHPKTGKFDSRFSYGKNFTNSKTRTAQDVYEDWFKEMEGTSGGEE